MLSRFFTYNISDSMPKGFYYLSVKTESIKKGDVVVIPIDRLNKEMQDMIFDRGYLPKFTKYLIKEVKGTHEDDIFLEVNELHISGEKFKIRKYDILKRSLPVLNNEDFILKKDEFITLGIKENSFDSRYFGKIKKNQVKYIAKKIN
ncbi:S26 family signal peptidase [Psychrilyobacter sp. S5]|uniref:S26 family signal peptidase n=1 Tax=Psychrilyobacter TaxID=623282 RepID=UPI0013894954|nr:MULTISPECIES: S26 family signal peptidase [Psychrilyobacter]MCS5420268.1 S26 family signal peptidase [Psychrilyobacter sp. S5]